MNRRNFLRALTGGVAAAAAVRTFPFRVFSIPAAPRIFYTDAIANVWYLNPDQAKAWDELLDTPIALRGTNRNFGQYCVDGSDLGVRGNVTYWRKATTYAELDRALADGYKLPEHWRYDKAKRLLVTDGKYSAPISLLDRNVAHVDRYLRGEWKT